MKVALIGASGKIGSHILKELINRKHQVTAIARNIERIDVKDSKVTPVSVDVNNTDELTNVLKDNKIVICAFNAGWDNPNLYDDNMKGYESIQKAVRAANIRRFFMVGNAGSLYVGAKQQVDSDNFPKEMLQGAKAVRDYAERLRRETYLDWVYLAPQIEINTTLGRTGKVRLAGEEPIVKNDVAFISIEDLAMTVVDEVEDKKYSGKRFTVGY